MAICSYKSVILKLPLKYFSKVAITNYALISHLDQVNNKTFMNMVLNKKKYIRSVAMGYGDNTIQ